MAGHELPPDLRKELDETRDGMPELAAQLCPSLDPSIRVDVIKHPEADRELGRVLHTAGPDRPWLYCIHGGGYYVLSAELLSGWYAAIAGRAGYNAFVVDYRLCPEASLPEATEDCVRGYRWLLEEQQIDSKNIVFYGDSAGGGLVALTMNAIQGRAIVGYPLDVDHYVCRKLMPKPRAIIMSSPWLDLTATTPHYRINNEVDLVDGDFFKQEAQFLPYFTRGNQTLDSISPKHIDPSGWQCPARLTVGTQETLLDDCTRFGEKLVRANINLSYQCYINLVHCGYYSPKLMPIEIGPIVDQFFKDQNEYLIDLYRKPPASAQSKL